MNAPARIDIDTLGWSEEEKRHRAAITIHLANEPPARMHCRVQIAMARDQASTGLSRCCPEAYGILLEVSRIAAGAVYQPASTNELYRIRFALTLAMDAARAMERAYRNGQ